MQDKLQALEDKYLDLEAKISDPDVIANQAEWQKYARAHAKLTDVVAAYREYKILDKAREEAEEIIADGSDRELAAMAQEELKELKPQLAEYEERLKNFAFAFRPQRRQERDCGNPRRCGRRGSGAVCRRIVPHVSALC